MDKILFNNNVAYRYFLFTVTRFCFLLVLILTRSSCMLTIFLFSFFSSPVYFVLCNFLAILANIKIVLVMQVMAMQIATYAI